MVVAQGVGGAIVRNLTNGTEYTFAVKTLDTSFNKSEEATAKATPTEDSSADTMKIALSVPKVKSNTSITITANITTEGTVKKVVCKQDGSINPVALLADTEATVGTVDASDDTRWTFTISATDETANGTYTVAAIDSNGREETEQITISNFDFTGPLKASGVTGTYSDSTITLNWTNPTDEDFDHLEICYTTNDGTSNSEKTAFEPISATETTKTYSNIESNKAYYAFYLVSVDKLGNKGNEKSCAVIVNKDSIKIPFGFVQVPAVSIKGDETWTPTSEVFVKDRVLEISSFYMCDHEVTQEEFKDVMGTNPSTAPADGTADDNPVTRVNWYHAIAYCNKLSIKDGLDPCYTVSSITNWSGLEYSNIPTTKDSNWSAATYDTSKNGYRLPTEAEWEWAARGGENYTYAGSDNIDEVAWYKSNSNGKTHEIKTKKANAYGLYDMNGNVEEWCWDRAAFTITKNTPATGLDYNSSEDYHIFHGGSYRSSSAYSSVSYRVGIFYSTGYSFYDTGFRVVRNVTQE